MAKGKRKVGSSSGLRKNHGPKRHMFKDFKPMVHVLAKDGVLSKYDNFESWQLAMAARGSKKATAEEFKRFVVLPLKDKKLYFKSTSK